MVPRCSDVDLRPTRLPLPRMQRALLRQAFLNRVAAAEEHVLACEERQARLRRFHVEAFGLKRPISPAGQR